MQASPQPTVAAPGVTVLQPGPQTVTVITNQQMQQNSHLCENYSTQQAYVLGVIQVIIGGLCIILQIAAIAIDAHAANSGAGIWCGILFLITGVLGIMSSRSKARGIIVACMVMCIISAVLVLPLLISASIGIGHDNDPDYCRWDWEWNGSYCPAIEDKEAKIGLNVCLLLLSLLECVVAIWASAVCCNAVCCGRSSMGGVIVTNQMPGQVQVVGGQGTFIQPGVYPGQPVVYQQQPAYVPQQPAYAPQQPAYSAPVPPGYSADAPPAYNQVQSSAPPAEKN